MTHVRKQTGMSEAEALIHMPLFICNDGGKKYDEDNDIRP